MSTPELGFNPLPWILDDEFHLDEPSLRGGFDAARANGFRAVQADVPADFSLEQYRALVGEYGLGSAPGYFGATLNDADGIDEVRAAARAHARMQKELGNTVVFVASDLDPRRIARPATGETLDAVELETVTRTIAAIAAEFRAEGLIPALHPHVGSLIESEAEVRAVLDAVDDLAFGPDTGHLYWAGIDPVGFLSEYRDRIAGVHLKDVDDAAVAAARADSADYRTSTKRFHVWTEPGRGGIDLHGVLDVLQDAPSLRWYVLEVDVPNIGTPEQSTATAAQWIKDEPRLGALVNA